MKHITLYKKGFEPVSPYECELKAYQADGWSKTKPSNKKAEATKPKQNTKSITTEA